MTKYNVAILTAEGWENIALFSSDVAIDSIITFCDALVLPYEFSGVAITDLDTGKILWNIL